ncbi:MAG: glycosyltransferase family 4 protein [Bacteroidota bacterium]
MRILLLHQYYKTPAEGGGIRSYHVAKALTKAGHNVTVISGHNETACTKNIKGVEVHYLNVPYANHFSFLRRLYSFWKYYRLALRKVEKLETPDLVYAISTPLSVGWLGKKVSQKWNCKFVFEVGDLWPEVPVKMGIIRNRLLSSWLYRIEKSIYDSASLIIALSPDMSEYIISVTRSKVIVVPNMSDTDFFKPSQAKNRDNTFRIGYFGTIGLANQLEYLLDAAECCQIQGLNVDFVVKGEGAKKPIIKKVIADKKLTNISLEGWSGMDEVKKSMACCQAVFLSFQNIPALHSGSPNKLFDGLAAGKVIVSNLTGWTKNVIEEENVGFYYNPNKPQVCVDQIKRLMNDSESLSEKQTNARRLAEREYSVQRLTNKITEELASF